MQNKSTKKNRLKLRISHEKLDIPEQILAELLFKFSNI